MKPPPADTIVRARNEQKKKSKELLKDQLALAIQWERLDIAEEYIFKNMVLEEEELNELLGIAIENMQVDFIKTLISKKANLKTFLSLEKFEEMLRGTSTNLLLYKLLEKECKNPSAWSFRHFQRVIENF